MAVRITDTPSLSVVAIVRSSEWWRMNAGGRERHSEREKRLNGVSSILMKCNYFCPY